MSYSQIKKEIPVSKGTLSLWLENYPLLPERIRELRDFNPRRIESYRATMKQKRDARIAIQEVRATKNIGKLSKRELFISGFFLFWGEGAKRRSGEVALANTDPAMIRCFVNWLTLLGADKEKLHFTLHMYADMDTNKEISYWAHKLGVRKNQFWKPYIKKTNLADISYRTGFGHGTCNARYMSQDFNDYVLRGLGFVRKLYEKE